MVSPGESAYYAWHKSMCLTPDPWLTIPSIVADAWEDAAMAARKRDDDE